MELSPKQYYLNLANNNLAKYNELLSFSKQFISGTLSSHTLIYGNGNNGKTIFITLLEILAKFNRIKIGRAPFDWFDDDKIDRMNRFLTNYDFIIMQEPDTSIELKKLSTKQNAKFIIIANNNDDLLSIPSIQMTATFTKHNSVDCYPQDMNDKEKKKYFDFIMNFVENTNVNQFESNNIDYIV